MPRRSERPASDDDGDDDLMVRSRSKRSNRTAVSYREMEEDDVGVHYTWKMESEESSAPQRRKRNTAKASPLDALSGASQPVPGSDHFTFSLGGAETGGPEAERVLREVEIDDDAISLRAQFARGRKVVLYAPNGKAVAAAVVEMHPSDAIFEVPILASARAHRQQGYGSVLVALLRELAIQLRCGMFVISATDESRQFWMRQGSDAAPVCDSMRRPPDAAARPHPSSFRLHAFAFCDAHIQTKLRALNQKAARYGFFETTPMAMSLPEMPEGEPGYLVRRSLAATAARREAPRGVAAARAAEALGCGGSVGASNTEARTAHPSARRRPAARAAQVRRRRRDGQLHGRPRRLDARAARVPAVGGAYAARAVHEAAGV